MVPRFLFIALDGVGDLPDAGSFGRVFRPGVIDRQPRPLDCCDAALSQALLFFVDRLDNDQALVQRNRYRQLLNGVGCCVGDTERDAKFRQGGQRVKSVPLAVDIQPDFRDRALGFVPCGLHVVGAGLSAEREVDFVGANPVGQHAQAQEHMLKRGCRRERRSAACPGRGKPVSHQPADVLHTTPGVQCAEGAPDDRILGSAALHIQRPAVVRQCGHEQSADRLPVAVVPGQKIIPPA